MAQNPSFLKRQKELARLARQQKKQEKREQRKLEKQEQARLEGAKPADADKSGG